jgi:cadmium resistance protein CadD (predicted permease)
MTNFEKTNSFVGIYKANIIGLFFLLAFLLYGFGRIFFESEISFGSYFGAFLILANSILVIYIGVFLRKNTQAIQCFYWEHLFIFQSFRSNSTCKYYS